MKIIKCDICGSDRGVDTYRLPVYRLHDAIDGLTQFEQPIVYLKGVDICEECLYKCTNIYDGTVMGRGDMSIRENPKLKEREE